MVKPFVATILNKDGELKGCRWWIGQNSGEKGASGIFESGHAHVFLMIEESRSTDVILRVRDVGMLPFEIVANVEQFSYMTFPVIRQEDRMMTCQNLRQKLSHPAKKPWPKAAISTVSKAMKKTGRWLESVSSR